MSKVIDLSAPFLGEGWARIGLIDRSGRRSLWLKMDQETRDWEDVKNPIELRAGREGEDAHVIIQPDNPAYEGLVDVLSRALAAAEDAGIDQYLEYLEVASSAVNPNESPK